MSAISLNSFITVSQSKKFATTPKYSFLSLLKKDGAKIWFELELERYSNCLTVNPHKKRFCWTGVNAETFEKVGGNEATEELKTRGTK